MPRRARIVIPKLAHHITQRGNYRQRIFEQKNDFQQYCRLMGKYAERYGVEVLAFCLMRNHVHFIVIPLRKDSLARTFNTVHMRYSQYINKKKRRHGHLWQGRFFSCVLDDQHLYRAMRYVERNPVRAGMVKQPWDYLWSSARLHIGIKQELKIPVKDSTMIDKKNWRRYLVGEDVQIDTEIRLKTQRGLVVGNQEFIKSLERKLQQSFACLNPGRPRKM